MDDINLVHILQDGVSALGRGVYVARTDNIDSKTFVCHLHGDALRFGFFYKNGSTGRIVYVNQEGEVGFSTVTKGKFIIAFEEVTTGKRFNGNILPWTAADIEQNWFDPEAQQLVAAELRALEGEDAEIQNLIGMLEGLNMQQVQQVVAFMNNI